HTSVDRRIADARGHHVADQDGRGSHRNDVWRTDTGRHVAHAGRGHVSDQDRGATRRQDGATDVRHDAGDHRTHMHVSYTSGWRLRMLLSPTMPVNWPR